jgi:kynurenine 3-monooxygenase
MSRQVTILGAGLVGSLLSIILKKRGYEVSLYERRPDMRKASMSAGKSINLATSHRGWKALELAGLKTQMEPLAIPMAVSCTSSMGKLHFSHIAGTMKRSTR